MVYRQRFNPKPPASVSLYLLTRPLQRTGALSFRHQCTHWCHLPPRGRLERYFFFLVLNMSMENSISSRNMLITQQSVVATTSRLARE